MLLDDGYGDGNLELRLVQLHEALLRACRYIVAIKLHTQNMPINGAYDYIHFFFVMPNFLYNKSIVNDFVVSILIFKE